jgi:chromate transport protein ChrA
MEALNILAQNISGLDAAITAIILGMCWVIIKTPKSQMKETLLATVCITIVVLALIGARVFLTVWR